jgi:hypothetical protein
VPDLPIAMVAVAPMVADAVSSRNNGLQPAGRRNSTLVSPLFLGDGRLSERSSVA